MATAFAAAVAGMFAIDAVPATAFGADAATELDGAVGRDNATCVAFGALSDMAGTAVSAAEGAGVTKEACRESSNASAAAADWAVDVVSDACHMTKIRQ